MKVSSLFSLATLASAASAVSVSFDRNYDNGNTPLTSVTCSDGPNGLITRYHWQTLGQVANFPNIGGAPNTAWNSPNCGTCWRLEYNGLKVNVLAVDLATTGFNIGLTAMNALTNGQAEQLGRVEATATQVDVKECGL